MASPAPTNLNTDFDYLKALDDLCFDKQIRYEVDYHKVNSKDGKGFTKPGDPDNKVYSFMTGCIVKFDYEGQQIEVKGHAIGRPDAKTGAARRSLATLFVQLFKENPKLEPKQFGLTKMDLIWYNTCHKQSPFKISTIPDSCFYNGSDQRKLFSNASSTNSATNQRPSASRPADLRAQENGHKPAAASFDGRANSSNWRDDKVSARGSQHSSPKRHHQHSESNSSRPVLGHDPYDSANEYEPSFEDDYSAEGAQSFHSDQSLGSFDGACARPANQRHDPSHNSNRDPSHSSHREHSNKHQDHLNKSGDRSDNRQRDQSDAKQRSNPSNGTNRFDSSGGPVDRETGGKVEDAIRYLIENEKAIRAIVSEPPQIFQDAIEQLIEKLPEFKVVHRQTDQADQSSIHFCRLLYRSCCVYLAFDKTTDGSYRKIFYFLKLQFAK